MTWQAKILTLSLVMLVGCDDVSSLVSPKTPELQPITTPPTNPNLPEKELSQVKQYQKSPELIALETELAKAKAQYAKKQAQQKANKKLADDMAYQARITQDRQTYARNQRANSVAEFNNAVREYQAALAQRPVQQGQLQPSQVHQGRHTPNQHDVDYCNQTIKGSHGKTAAQMRACARASGHNPSPTAHGYTISNPTPTQSTITNCDGAGCWGSDGTRYNSAGNGNYHSSNGRFCQDIGGQMRCH